MVYERYQICRLVNFGVFDIKNYSSQLPSRDVHFWQVVFLILGF